MIQIKNKHNYFNLIEMKTKAKKKKKERNWIQEKDTDIISTYI